MKNVLEYKGYHTKIEFDHETMTLRGKIEGINDFIDFECDNLENVEKEFHEAVDDYLEFCSEVGKNPEKEYRGSFNVRISPELHRKMAVCAFRDGCSLNSEIEKAILSFLNADPVDTTTLVESIRNLKETIQMDCNKYGNETTVFGTQFVPYTNLKHTYIS